jgi:hypothetical protein
MSTEAVQRARRAEYEKDYGRCVYCGGYAYAMVGNWVNHLLTEHPDTVRTMALRLALQQAEQEAEAELDA